MSHLELIQNMIDQWFGSNHAFLGNSIYWPSLQSVQGALWMLWNNISTTFIIMDSTESSKIYACIGVCIWVYVPIYKYALSSGH